MDKRTKNLIQIRESRTLIVGVDIAKKTHWARMIDNQTGIETGAAFSFKNNTEGFSRLLGKMTRAREQIHAEGIVVAMEPSGHYWKPLAAYLIVYQGDGSLDISNSALLSTTKSEKKMASIIAFQKMCLGWKMISLFMRV